MAIRFNTREYLTSEFLSSFGSVLTKCNSRSYIRVSQAESKVQQVLNIFKLLDGKGLNLHLGILKKKKKSTYKRSS